MRFRHNKYPIPCARVHGAIGTDALHLRASAACFAHQNEQRPAGEITLFDVGSDPAAVGGTVRLTSIVPFSSFAAHPVGTLQTVRRASIGGHGSASEGFAHKANEPRSLRFLARHLAQQLQAGSGAGDQHVNGGQPMAWVNALVGWARCGERRHLTVTAGAMLMLALTATLAMGV